MAVTCGTTKEVSDINPKSRIITLECWLEEGHGEGFHFDFWNGLYWRADSDGDGHGRDSGGSAANPAPSPGPGIPCAGALTPAT